MNVLSLLAFLPLLAQTSLPQRILLENGIYRQVTDLTAPTVTTEDGKVVHLQRLKTLPKLKDLPASQNNANTRFLMAFTLPVAESSTQADYALVVGEKTYLPKFAWFALNEPHLKELHMTFEMNSLEKAKEVALYFKVTPFLRRHPRHVLVTSFTPTKSRFQVGENVTVKMKIENVGETTFTSRLIRYGGSSHNSNYYFCLLSETSPVQEVPAKHVLVGSSTSLTLKPKDVFERTIDLSAWFVFTKAGTYFLHGTYHFAFMDPSYKINAYLWEDFAGENFEVEIVNAPPTAQPLSTQVKP